MSDRATATLPATALDRRSFLALGAGMMVAGAATGAPRAASAGPASKLIDDRWTRFGDAGDPDQSGWGSFLGRYLKRGPSGVMLVDYSGATASRDALKGYIDALQAVQPTTLSRDAAMAYWFNMYNAVTIDLVLDAWPVDSIKKVRGGLFNTGPWGDDVVRVEGQDLSLDDIEHGIMRPVWNDPRIHYGVNCASIGCPDLATKPFTSADLDTMLDAGARAYTAHPRGARLEGGDVIVSTIYDWFNEDFGGTEASILAHIAQYAPADKANELKKKGGIDDYEYDWSINAVKSTA
ncbi:MAG: DUF547 domain-containing protein [Pseudomonadota bacterium]